MHDPPRPDDEGQEHPHHGRRAELTNARKHAPGTAVTVTLSGSPGDGMTTRVHNPVPVGAPPSRWPDSGLGLVGLEERVALAGGRIEHGADPSGGYALSAWIPWQA